MAHGGRLLQAIESLNQELAQAQLASQTVVDEPDGVDLEQMASSIVVPAVENQFRLVVIGNVGAVDACLSIEHDAVSGMGIPVSPGAVALTIPLGPGRSLNGITNAGNTRLTFQSFGTTLE